MFVRGTKKLQGIGSSKYGWLVKRRKTKQGGSKKSASEKREREEVTSQATHKQSPDRAVRLALYPFGYSRFFFLTSTSVTLLALGIQHNRIRIIGKTNKKTFIHSKTARI
jgi:hypothetical protein